MCASTGPHSAPSNSPSVNGTGPSASAQRREEPREPEQRHQRAEAGLRPPPPRVQAGADEAPADERPEDRPAPRSLTRSPVTTSANTARPAAAAAAAMASERRASGARPAADRRAPTCRHPDGRARRCLVRAGYGWAHPRRRTPASGRLPPRPRRGRPPGTLFVSAQDRDEESSDVPQRPPYEPSWSERRWPSPRC